MDTRDAAIRAARAGMRVFPVHGVLSPGTTEIEARCQCGNTGCGSPGKHPVAKGWQKAATTDISVINGWFSRDGGGNFGVALDGKEWTVVEVDSYAGGHLKALREAVQELGPISTSGRGHHVWFKETNLRNGTEIGSGMTVRAAGYYVVGPGSTHYTGRRYGRRTYGFDRIDERPDLVVTTFSSSSPEDAKGSHVAVARKIPEEISDGEGRWRHLLSVAGSLVSRGLPEATVLDAVRVVNRNHFKPPKDDHDVVRLVRYVIQHDGATEGCKEDDFDPQPVTGPMMIAEITNSLHGKELANEVLAEAEKILEGGGDDGHRAPDQEVGDPPAGGAGGRPTDPGASGAGEGTAEGAGEGPGVEPRAGEIKGYRVFWVRGDGLYSYAMAGAWAPGTNTAHCPRAGAPSTPKHKPAKRTTWVNDDGKLKQITLEDDDETDEPTHGLIPSLNCSCGFWVYKSAERARAQFASELRRPRSSRYGDFDGDDELVMAEVVGWGGAVEGGDGWRFEKAKVVGLITDAPHRFRAILDRYKIPALQSVGLAPWLRNFEARPLAEVLAALEDYVSKYVILTAEQRCAIVLWVAHTWAVDASDVSPYLSVTSAVMRSGKSQLVETLSYVVAEPWPAVQPSEAVLFRRIDRQRPTLLLDEVDTLFHSKDDRHEPLRALLNAGNRRGTTVPRIVPGARKGDFETHDFEIFCPKLLAGIGHPPVTVADRSIPIRMEKKLPDDVAARFRGKLVKADATESRQQLALWAASGVVDRLKEAWPRLPEELNDRAQDCWEPLFAISEDAGAGWPERARAAAVALARAFEDGVDHKVQLLGDMRDIFRELDLARVPTDSLIRALVEKDPWGAWWGDQVEAGKMKSPGSRLARMLGEFGIKPKQLWIGGMKTRGYERADFVEPWKRNLPDLPPGDGRDGRDGRPLLSGGSSDQQPTVHTVPTVSSGDGEAVDLWQFISDWNADVYEEAQDEMHTDAAPEQGLPGPVQP